MSEYKKVKLGDIFTLEKGSLQSSKCTPGQYDFITAAEDWKTHESYTHDCESIVYAVAASGSLGRAHYVNGKFIASDLCFIMQEKDKEKYPVNFQFYQIIFEVLRDEIVSKTKTGTSKESISQKNLSKYEIPYFDYDFQIANYERLVRTKQIIAEILKETESQKAYAKQLRQNILQDAIEGKLTADLPCRQAGWRQPFKNLSGKIVPKQSCKYFAYVLECDDGSLYKGYSENLYERINRHLDGGGSEWTQKHKPISLIHFEEFDTEKEALEREKYFKSGSGREWLNEIRNKNKLDFDAEALFEEIQKEKKTDKKQKELAPISDDDLPAGKAGKPFEIPDGWKWVRLGSVVNVLSGFAFKSDDFLDNGKYRLLRGINLGVEIVRWDDTVFINTITEQLNNFRVKKNDIILGLDRPWIAEGIRVAIYDEQEDSFLVQRVLRIRESFAILKELIVMLLQSKYFRNTVESQTTGISVLFCPK